MEQIVSKVRKVFIDEMPKFHASLMLNLNRGYPMQAVSSETENSRTYAEDGLYNADNQQTNTNPTPPPDT